MHAGLAAGRIRSDFWSRTGGFVKPTKRAVRTSSAISTKRVRREDEARKHKRRPRARQVRAHEVSRITVGIYLRPFSSVARRPRQWSLFPFCSPPLMPCIRLSSGKRKKRRKETWTNSAESNRLENFQPGSEDPGHFVERKLTR